MDFHASRLGGTTAGCLIHDGDCAVDFRPGQGGCLTNVPRSRTENPGVGGKDREDVEAVDLDVLEPSPVRAGDLGMIGCVMELFQYFSRDYAAVSSYDGSQACPNGWRARNG